MGSTFAYYVRLAVLSIRQNPIMSTLMVCAIALGVGICMTAVNVRYLLDKDPIPAKSDVLHAVQLDSTDRPYRPDGRPPPQLTYLDASALMAAQRGGEPPAFRQAAMARTGFVVEPTGEGARPFDASGRAASASFFAMFDVPFLFGSGWDARAGRDGEQVAVLAKGLNERLFGGEDSVGRSIRLTGRTYRVVGVYDDWRPLPKFYDMNNNPIGPPADIFVPFSLMAKLALPRNGNVNCWKTHADGLAAFLASECLWIQLWAELRNDEEKNRYLAFLSAHATEQKRLGRFGAAAQQPHQRRQRMDRRPRTGHRPRRHDGGCWRAVPRRLLAQHGGLAAREVPRQGRRKWACVARRAPASERSSASTWWRQVASAWLAALSASA